MKKIILQLCCLTLLLFSQYSFGQCDANSPNVELTITSIDITAACAGDPPLNSAIEPSISINGTIITFQPAGSANDCTICTSSDVVPGNYPVTNADIIDGCSPSTTISLGAAGGSTMIPVTVEAWEEDSSPCMFDPTGINADDDIFANTTFMVDITQPTGSFVTGCYTYNYSIACPEPCEVSACKEVQICITGVAVTEGDGILSDPDPAITIGGNTYLWDNGIPSADGSIYPLGNADATCTAGPACVTFITDMAATNATTLMGVQAWEEDFDCGSSCTPDPDCGLFGDDDDNVTAVSNVAITNVNIDGTFLVGDYEWQYEVTSCTQLLVASSDGLVVSSCSDESTLDDMDDTYTFDLDPLITEQVAGSLGTGYDIAFSNPVSNGYVAPTNNAYGAATTFGPLLISDGPQIVTISDQSGCISFDVLVSPPAACSSCGITSGTWSK